jgi:hypothetical protein
MYKIKLVKLLYIHLKVKLRSKLRLKYMHTYISYFAGIVVALVRFLPRWVCCYELLYVHMRSQEFRYQACI